MPKTKLFPVLVKKIEHLEKSKIPAYRQKVLQPMIDYVQQQKDHGAPITLNFICTHNSRRSQLAQVWAWAISRYYGIKTDCYSGGTEETAFFKNAVEALRRAGFIIKSGSGQNPLFEIFMSEEIDPLICYSKVYDAPENPSEEFAALMTCSNADENCPFIPGSKARIPLDYKDPKEFDDTPFAMEKYEERSEQIASEMIHVFQNIK
ncbi:protein-tyrosine-phosphatase [Pontixanthobacter gangjinensis]|uniref:Protein-tyrosine-phosphatase n=1 Tax=Christiangramia aestuarii TaxID=1028746 RepID=A0A7M3SX90_9FLAO|nr:protein-tyrosine-phosphatase [Christiangramia aestuarii]MUP41221.1 protein-tyrosine-phosphatase [Christiangramia aestuarii]